MTPQDMDARIVRYGDLQPCKTAFIDAHTPGSDQKENFTIIGGGVSESPDQHVHINLPHGFNIGAAGQPPHCRNSLHSHRTAEVFFVLSGRWRFFWGRWGDAGEVILNEGKVVDAVRATISVPVIFKPVERDNMILVDGGILNNVPTDVAKGMGADQVIAVDVMPDFSQNTPGQPLVVLPIDPPSLPTFLQEAFHIEYLMISAMTRCKLQANPPDVLIRPDIPAEIDLLIGYDRAQEVIDIGEQATLDVIQDIAALT